MINPAFLKVGLGGAIATSAGTVGIVYRDKIKDFFSNLSSNTSTYLIVKTTAAADSDITKLLYEDENKTKNFFCVVTSNENKKDDGCEIFAIKAPTTNKLNNLNDIKDSKTNATKENITTDTFFKLTISDSVLGSALDGTQTIDIVSKTEEKTGNTGKKKYGSFTIQYKITNTNENITVEGKTNWIIGKITVAATNSTISDISNLTCSISGETPVVPSACSIFKIETSETDYKNIETSNIKAATTTTAEYAVNKYFVIDLKDNKKNITDFTGKTITVNVTSGSVKIGDFSFVTALVANGVFSTSSKTIILS